MFNLKDLERQHRAIEFKFQRALAYELDQAGEHAERYVFQKPGFTRRTGNLQKQTEHKVVRKSGRTIVLNVRNRAKYAAAIDKGSPPHLIVARRSRALSFTWKGVPMFRRWVMHPGNKPYRFLSRATHSAGGVFHKSMLLQMERIAKVR